MNNDTTSETLPVLIPFLSGKLLRTANNLSQASQLHDKIPKVCNATSFLIPPPSPMELACCHLPTHGCKILQPFCVDGEFRCLTSPFCPWLKSQTTAQASHVLKEINIPIRKAVKFLISTHTQHQDLIFQRTSYPAAAQMEKAADIRYERKDSAAVTQFRAVLVRKSMPAVLQAVWGGIVGGCYSILYSYGFYKTPEVWFPAQCLRHFTAPVHINYFSTQKTKATNTPPQTGKIYEYWKWSLKEHIYSRIALHSLADL